MWWWLLRGVVGAVTRRVAVRRVVVVVVAQSDNEIVCVDACGMNDTRRRHAGSSGNSIVDHGRQPHCPPERLIGVVRVIRLSLCMCARIHATTERDIYLSLLRTGVGTRSPLPPLLDKFRLECPLPVQHHAFWPDRNNKVAATAWDPEHNFEGWVPSVPGTAANGMHGCPVPGRSVDPGGRRQGKARVSITTTRKCGAG